MLNRNRQQSTENRHIRYGFFLLFAGMIAASPAFGTSMPFMGMFGGHGSHGYVGPVFKLSAVQNEPGIGVGLRGGWMFEQAYSVGLAGYWLLTEIEQTNRDPARLRYGGVEFQAFVGDNERLRFAVHTLIGVGIVGDDMHFLGHRSNRHETGVNSDNFFVVEPGVALLMDITEYVQWGIGVSYLVTSGWEFQDMPAEQFGGLTGTFTLTFGGR